MELIRTVNNISDFYLLLNKIPNGALVKAAFAYGKDVQHGDGLLEILQEKKAPLKYWASFDAEQSTSPDFLEKILQSPHNQLYLVRMEHGVKFHPKILYIENFGVYIGSANMTESGIYRNIELGVFITKEELKGNPEFHENLHDFFQHLEEGSTKALFEDIEKYKKFCAENLRNDKQEKNAVAESLFDQEFAYLPPIKSSFSCEDRKSRENKRKQKFLKEWRGTLGLLRSITEKYFNDEKHYPLWMKGQNFSPNIVCDRFLHYFYEEEVMKSEEEGNSIERVEIFYNKNKKDPEDSLRKAVIRFQALQESYDENTILFMDAWAKDNKKLLSKEKIQNLTEEELRRLYEQTHALRDHARHMENHKLKLVVQENERIPGSEKARALASIHFEDKTEKRHGILDILEYLIWGNDDVENRIWEVCEGDYKISDMGKSSVGEFLGWALPEKYPIRNGRTNKALRALGYDVLIS
jgi:hypothetical protein